MLKDISSKRRIQMKAIATRLFTAVILTLVLASSLLVYQTARAAGSCSCLVYVQNNKTLPPTGDAYFKAYKYGDFLSTYKGSYAPKGYKISYVTPSKTFTGPGQLSGAAIVFNPSAFYADGTYGHIGIVVEARYNSSTKLWTIRYRDANGWTSRNLITLVQGLFTESNCTNVGIRDLVTSNLSGVRFFRWSKK